MACFHDWLETLALVAPPYTAVLGLPVSSRLTQLGGDKEEFIMLALRLTDGLTDEIWYKKFQEPLPQAYIKRAQIYESAGLVHMKKNGFALTPKGFLVSNQLILSIIDV